MHGYRSLCIPYFINFTFCAFFLSCPSIPLFANRDSKEEEHKPPTIINSAPPNNQAKQKSSQIQTKIKPNKNQHKPTWSVAQTQTKINTNPHDLLHKPTQTQTKINTNPHRLSLAATATGFPCCHRQILYCVWMSGLRSVPCLDRSSNGIDQRCAWVRISERCLE